MAKHEIKLPKRVAGIKIPKAIRKGPIGHFLNSSAGQLVLAETILAAAAAFTAAKTDDDSPVGETVRHPVDSARRMGRALATAGASETDRLTHAFRAAGKAFREALHDNEFFAVWPEDVPGAKKKASSRAESRIH